MNTTVYFNSENEFREYAEKKGIEYIEDEIECANQGRNYYNPFANIEGCKVGYVWQEECLHMCIWWKGHAMRVNFNGFSCYFDEKTYELCLCETTDWQGINKHRYSVPDGDVPQKIGKPTAKKLDNWLNYLLDLKQREEESRDRAFARMTAKIEEVKNNFPEAENVKWEKGDWNFRKVNNGLEYIIQINCSGEIYEKLEFASYQQHYTIGTAEKAARMMQNALAEVKPISKECDNPYQLEIDAYETYVNQFMGKRPF